MEGYVYKIIFEDGCWYWGTSKYKGCLPERDGYYGSPVTHKERWNYPFSKIVIKEFQYESERINYETECIKNDLGNPRCLNEHAAKAFSKKTCSKGGQEAAKKSRGVPRLPEIKEKISRAHRGKKLSPDHIKKLKEAKRPLVTPEATEKRLKSRDGYKHSEETKRKIKESNSGKKRTESQKRKISKSVRGFKWYNDGKSNVQSRQHPGEGWVEGRIISWNSPKTKGMKAYHKNGKVRLFKENPGEGWTPGIPRPKGKKYYNNGFEHVLAFESPGEGWNPGRLRKT